MTTDDIALRPRRSVLYMPSSNERALEKAKSIPCDGLILDLEDAVAPQSSHGCGDSAGVGHVLDAGAEDLVGDRDLLRVQAPGPDAPEKVGVAELVLAGDGVGDVAERPVERQDPVRHAGIDHAGDRVVPEVLLVRRSLGVDVRAVGADGRVVAAMNEQSGDGTGAVLLDGKMEDDASVKQCKVIMALAEELAARDPDLAASYGFAS